MLQHPRAFALGGLAVIVLGMYGAAQIVIADDTRALIANADPEIERRLEILDTFSPLDHLLISVNADAAPEHLEDAATFVRDALQNSDAINEAYYESDPQNLMALMSALKPRRFLLDPRDPAPLFEPADLKNALMQMREALLSPQGMLQKSFLLGDPLGSTVAALKSLDNAPGLTKLDATSGRFYAREGHRILIIAKPKGAPFAGDAAARTMEHIDRVRLDLGRRFTGVAMHVIGAHRFAYDAQQTIMHDIHLTFSLTLVSVIVIFVAFFRRLRLVWLALPPLLFAAAIAGGVAGGLGKPIHGIVLAFSAACLGLSIDYTIHLLAAFAGEEGDMRSRLIKGSGRIGNSLILAAVSTTLGLGVLTLSHVDALAQMALLASVAILAALVGNLIWLPLIAPRLIRTMAPPDSLRGPWVFAVELAKRRPRALTAAAIACAAGLVLAAQHTTIDGDLHNLDSRGPEAQADIRGFENAFGNADTTSLAVAEAPTLDEALVIAHRAYEKLRDLGIERILSPTFIAPPKHLREQRRAAWCSTPEKFIAALDSEASAIGFRGGAFNGFADDLNTLCAEERDDEPIAALNALGLLLGRPIVLPKGNTHGVRLALAFDGKKDAKQEAQRALSAIDGITLVDSAEVNGHLTRIIAEDLPRLALWALLLVTALLVIAYRTIALPLRALVPCVLGMLATLGVLALLAIPINLINLCVFPLIAGLGIDYGIIMAAAEHDPHPNAHRERAFSVVVAAATTLAGFGTLALADYNAIATIGRSVVIAVSASAIFALLFTPALARLGRSSAP